MHCMELPLGFGISAPSWDGPTCYFVVLRLWSDMIIAVHCTRRVVLHVNDAFIYFFLDLKFPLVQTVFYAFISHFTYFQSFSGKDLLLCCLSAILRLLFNYALRIQILLDFLWDLTSAVYPRFCYSMVLAHTYCNVVFVPQGTVAWNYSTIIPVPVAHISTKSLHE